MYKKGSNIVDQNLAEVAPAAVPSESATEV